LYKLCLSSWIRPDQTYDNYAKRKILKVLSEEGSGAGTFTPFDDISFCASALVEGKQFKRALKKTEEMIQLLQDPPSTSSSSPSTGVASGGPTKRGPSNQTGSSTSRDNFAMFYYLKGASLKGLKTFDRAKQMFERAISEEGRIQHETFVVPYSLIALAEIALEEATPQGDTKPEGPDAQPVGTNTSSASATNLSQIELAQQYLDKAKSTSYGNTYDWSQLLGFRTYFIKQKMELKKKSISM